MHVYLVHLNPAKVFTIISCFLTQYLVALKVFLLIWKTSSMIEVSVFSTLLDNFHDCVEIPTFHPQSFDDLQLQQKHKNCSIFMQITCRVGCASYSHIFFVAARLLAKFSTEKILPVPPGQQKKTLCPFRAR